MPVRQTTISQTTSPRSPTDFSTRHSTAGRSAQRGPQSSGGRAHAVAPQVIVNAIVANRYRLIGLSLQDVSVLSSWAVGPVMRSRIANLGCLCHNGKLCARTGSRRGCTPRSWRVGGLLQPGVDQRLPIVVRVGEAGGIEPESHRGRFDIGGRRGRDVAARERDRLKRARYFRGRRLGRDKRLLRSPTATNLALLRRWALRAAVGPGSRLALGTLRARAAAALDLLGGGGAHRRWARGRRGADAAGGAARR